MLSGSGRTGAASWSSRTARPALLTAFVLALAACGQVPGTPHLPPGPQAAAPGASPNGENQTPAAGTFTYQIKTAKPAVVTKVPKSTPARPLATCPVRGRGYIANDFGAPRYSGGYHPHAGNDVFAPQGTPIVASFEGVAVKSPNKLGGNAVKVYGPLGYAYNAHLASYGKLGPVKATDVIGYVGDTGNALGGPPHDHFEWHPGNGPAVDPFPYLKAACAPSSS
jgi:murein DD-endopeptidase MepM/ murein hydrolase activator NlpD